MPQPEPVFAPLPIDAVWAIEPAAWDRIREGLVAARGGFPLGAAAPVLERADGIAVINVNGPMTRESSLISLLFGGTSTMAARDAVEAAMADESVQAILLRINSPGGSVSGLSELGDAVYAARDVKPVVAQVNGLAASAALYVASQASQIFAHRMDLLGSIGTRMMLYDSSALFAKEGVEAVPIDTGPFKSAGAQGTKLTDEHRAYFQSIVDEAQRDFAAVLGRGRRITAQQVESLADGRVFYAPEALSRGVIDGIQSEKHTLAALRAALPKTGKEKKRMSAATYQELVAACGGINPSQAEDAQFLCDQLAQGVEADAASKHWTQTLVLRADAAREERAAAERRASEAEAAKARTLPGTDPLLEGGTRKSGGAGYGDAVSEMDAAVRERRTSHPSEPRRKAVLAVARENPHLHRAYIEATNPGRRAQALIADRFDGE
jgi:signal peptide peptidase SppA